MSEPPPESPQKATAPPPPEDPALLKTLRDHGPGRLVFGRFRLVRELGAGGMAVVWLANDERLGLEVALKFLPGMVAHDPEALHDLRREITRCLKLTHEGIVRVYDLHEDSAEGLAAIAMEFIDGSTLADEKAKQPDRCFDVEEPLISYVRQICDVLSYVHEKKVVHRDLKPRNIMVTKEGRIKIADFGIAATMADSHSRLTQHPGSSGTPVYMSPQQALAQNPTVADDIYSLGATLYELLTSKPPFFRGSMAVILNAVASQVPPTMMQRREELGINGRAEIAQIWEGCVARCLSKAAKDRPESVDHVRRTLDGRSTYGESKGLSPEVSGTVENNPTTELLKGSPSKPSADRMGVMSEDGVRAKIVVSYRPEDTQSMASKLFDRLEAAFGKSVACMGIDEVPTGADLRAVVSERLLACNLLIVMIGAHWEGRSQDGKRRIDSVDDHVRVEITTALKRGVPIIPVLVEGARMPNVGSLPEDLRDLALRQTMVLDNGVDFRIHVGLLISTIRDMLGPLVASTDVASLIAACWVGRT